MVRALVLSAGGTLRFADETFLALLFAARAALETHPLEDRRLGIAIGSTTAAIASADDLRRHHQIAVRMMMIGL